MTSRLPSATIGLLLVAAALVGCSPTPAPEKTSQPSDSASSPTPTAGPATTPEPDRTPGALSCESMISPGTVDALTAQGWTAETKEFVIGDVPVGEDAGLLCFWADYSIASDHGQFYGWAAISPTDAASAQNSLLTSGWRREDAGGEVIITEDPAYAMATDDEGYGMTYLFGDGWVEFADTKQGLLLIEWTP